MAVVGSTVTYIDPTGEEHAALVTQRWDGFNKDASEPITPTSAINLVYVSDSTSETDQYGRQIKRETSVQGENPGTTAPGRFWRE